MLLGTQVRSGTTEGENCLALRTPGNGARLPERKARAGEAPEEKEEEKEKKQDRGALATRRTYLHSGRPPGASCRSLGPSSCPFP